MNQLSIILLGKFSSVDKVKHDLQKESECRSQDIMEEDVLPQTISVNEKRAIEL